MLVDSFMLAAVIHELRAFQGATVRRIRPVAPWQIALLLQGRGNRAWVLASAHTRYAHVGWQPEAPFSEPFEHPETVRFAETLSRHLEGAKLVGAEQVDFDRLLLLRFVTVTPLGERKRFALWAEIMGKHSNLVLVDEESQLIVDALKRLPSSVNRYREVLPNRPYLRPPTGERRNPLAVTPDELSQLATLHPVAEPRDWAKLFFGMSEALLTLMAEQIGEPLNNPDAFGRALQWLREMVQQRKFAPTVWRDKSGVIVWCYPFPCHQSPIATARPEPVRHFGPPLCEWLNSLAHRETAEQRRQSLLGELRRQLEGVEQQLKALRQRWQETQDADRYRRWGELLLTFAHEIPDGVTEAVVTDYDADPPQTVRIPLPEGKTVTDAAQHYFALYRKLKNAADALPSVMERLQRRADELRQLMEQVQNADESELAKLREEARAQATPSPPSVQRDGEFLRYVVAGGYEVWVGRNADANAKLLHLARPDDLWFHVKGAPGSHALLRVRQRNEQVPPDAIREAAQLAAYHSRRRTSAWVEVDYTRAKYVRPAKGQKGLALYTHFKTIAVEPKTPDDIATTGEGRR
jgi:predicted ribosome quality control (RQC) complex YloA/Tae2 family protein